MPEGTAALVAPQEARIFSQLVRGAAAAYGERTAIRLDSDGGSESLTFRQLDEQSAELAKGLLARGVGKGTRIGFIFGNGPTFALIFAAIARIGAIAVPISTLIKSAELVRVLRQSDIAGLILHRHFLGHDYIERLCEALPDLANHTDQNLALVATPYLRWVLSSGDELPRAIGNMGDLWTAASAISDALLEAVEQEVHSSDQMVEIYTSGSMALPKGVKHNHGPVLFRCHYIRKMAQIQAQLEYSVPLPMFWVGGLMMYLLPPWEAGGTVVCTDRTMSNSRVAMGSVLQAEDIAVMAQSKPYWGLGMSETLGPYAYGDEVRADDRPLCAPMDHIADGYDVRIVDDAGEPVADGVVGEIQVRGYPVTPGLHKLERDLYFTRDGYYRTGDMCQLDGNRIHFVGRNGDMIKTAGSNVSPAEVELELQRLDGIQSAYVVGLPDTERGELVAAALVPRDGAVLDFGAIEAELRRRLSSYKVPRAYISISRENVPLLHSNKIARREIQAMIARHLERSITT